nr:MAG TPA: hypothetical protein [Caudoviricetes sp.]
MRHKYVIPVTSLLPYCCSRNSVTKSTKSVYDSRTFFRKLSKQSSNRVSSYQRCFIQ